MLLTLPFLGNRNYLQSSTLWEALLEVTEIEYPCTLKIRKPLFSNHVKISSYDPDPHATLTWENHTVTVSELPASGEPWREPFPEKVIWNKIEKADDMYFYRSAQNNFALPRLAISLFKYCLIHTAHLPGNVQWMFIQSEMLSKQPFIIHQIALSEIQNSAVAAKATITVNGEKWSHLYFTRAPISQGTAS